MNRLAGSPSGRRLAASAAAFAAGAIAGVTGVAGLGLAAGLGVVAVLAAGLGVVAVLAGAIGVARPRLPIAGVVVLAFALGIARGVSGTTAPGPDRVDGHLGTRSVALLGIVRETSPGGAGPVIVDVRRIADSETDAAIGGGVLVSGPNVPALAPGDEVEVDATGIRAPSMRPGPESEATLERKDVEAVAVSPLVSVVRHGGLSVAGTVARAQTALVNAVNAVLPAPQGALVLGIAFGIRQPLAAEVRAPLQDSGLIHIVVVSGLKVVMLLGLVGAAGSVLGWSRRRRILAALTLAGTYVLISGAGPAAVRSFFMAGAALVAGDAGRRTDPLPMLALAAAVMLGVDPAIVRDPGFQLSFLGTAGILLLARPLAHRLPGPRLLVEPFAVTVAAQIATAPVMAATFGVLALLGPVANALVLPLLPALIVAGGAGALAGVVAPVVAWPLLQVAGVGATVVVVVARICAAMPGAVIQIGQWPAAWTFAEIAALAAFTVVVGMRGRRGVALASACSLLAGVSGAYAASRPDGRLHVTVLSVGAAPAVLVRGQDGGLALIDGGISPGLLLQALGRVLLPTDHRLDQVIVTGGEESAVAGLAGLPGHYDVGTVMASRDLTPGAAKVVAALQENGAAVVEPAGRAWRWGGATWQCLLFRAAATDRQDCAVTVVAATGRALFLGTTGTADQEELCGPYATRIAAELLVAEPGGSLSTALLGLVRPRLIAVPTATGAFTAPAPAGYTVMRTGADGDLRFDGGGGGLDQGA